MRKLLALLVVLAGAIPLFGQGTSFPVFNRQGWTMAGAVVSVCNGPADPGASAIPCTGLQSTTYVDWTLTTTCTNMGSVPNPPGPPLGPTHGTGCTNPGLTDSHGNATIFAANGFYWAQVAGYQVVPQSFPFDIGSGGGGGGLTPCGQPTDIQNYFTNIALGCDTGIGILDPSQHLISENHLNANQQVSVGNGTANGLMCQGHSNGTAIDAAYCTQPSATFSTTGLGYGLFPPDNQPTGVGNVVTVSSLTTVPITTSYGTIGFYPTHFVTAVSGLVFCELMSPLADCNAPLSGGTPTNDIIRAFYDVSPLLVWQGPPIGAGGMPYGFNVNQCQDNTGSLSSAVCPFISSLTAGDAILVSIVNDSGGTLVTPTDTLGNTFTALNVTGGTGFWYAKNVKAGLDTVTVGLGAAGGYMVQVLEAAGADPTAPVDVGALSHPSCSGTGPQTLTFSALTTTTQDGIIVLNTMSGISGGPYGTFTPGTLFLPTNSQTTHYGGGGLGASRSISTGYIPALITGLQTAPTMVFTNLPSGSCGGSTAYTVALKPANADGPQKPHYGFISLDMLDYANGPIPNPAGLGGDAIVATADGTGYTLAAAGSGTVNSGTATHLAYYATSVAAVSDMGADFTFSTHTLSGGSSAVLDLSGGSLFKIPVAASATAGAAGVINEDSTAKNYHIFANGADAIIGSFASTPTNGHCVEAVVSTGNILLQDAGGACATSSATALSFNGSGAGSTANINGTSPAAATDGFNVLWQTTGATSASAYVKGYGTIKYGFSYVGAVGASATGLTQVGAASTLPANLATPTSTCVCGTNPTSTFLITLKDGASTVGTISLSSSCVATLATTGGSAQTLNVDDQLYAITPASPDATAANISCLVRASRN